MNVFRKSQLIIVFVVLDNVQFVLRGNVPEYGTPNEFQKGNITFVKQGKKNFYVGYFNTLRITIYENRVEVKNSLATYFYGHNYIDITHNQLYQVIDDICNLFGCSDTDLLVQRIEFGFTIEIPYKPQRIMRRLIMSQNKEPQKTHRAGKLIETLFDNVNFSYKAYDKGLLELLANKRTLKGNFLRIEMKSNRAHFKTIAPIETAYDLMQPRNLFSLFNGFRKQWQQIRKAPILNPEILDKKQYHEVYAQLNPLWWFDIAENKSESAVTKAKFRFFNEELLQIGDYSIFNNIERRFTEKFIVLMGKENVQDFPTVLIAEKGGHFKSKKNEEITA